MNRQTERRGLTLLEILVVIGIVAVLVGFLLPAIQGLRAAAVKTRSANKLRQIILATHHYAAVNADALPGFDRSITGGQGPGTFEPILPFLEGETTLTPNPYHSEQWDYVPAYVSPADVSFTSPLRGPGSKPRSVINIAGDHSYPANWQALRVGYCLGTSFPDGTSTTIAFAERYARCFETETWWLLIYNNIYQDPEDINPPKFEVDPLIRRPTFADPDYDDVQPVTTDGVSRPSVPGQTFQAAPTIDGCDYRVPQTPHTNGMLTAFMDGSVRSIRPNIAPEVFWGAVTPNGGEVQGEW